MIVDSKYLNVSIDPSFFTVEGKTKDGKGFEIWDDGDIALFSGDDEVMLHVNELEEIIRVYKLYRDRRVNELEEIIRVYKLYRDRRALYINSRKL